MKGLDTLRWVPSAPEDFRADLAKLAWDLRGQRLCLITGAGCSTESGIPDYRGEETARRARNPIRLAQFLENEAGRRRYWARSMIGWPRFRSALPNSAHRGATRLEKSGCVVGIVTQNVDRLHSRAGAHKVVELHGALEEVLCLACGALEHRDELQARLEHTNPDFLARAFELAPDGDADIDERLVEGFHAPDCVICGGVLKPNVVFFGEGVPATTVDAAWKLYEKADAVLVVGSSLTVYSGFRFARRAAREKKPLYLINIGPTRADELCTRSVAAPAGFALDYLAEQICGG